MCIVCVDVYLCVCMFCVDVMGDVLCVGVSSTLKHTIHKLRVRVMCGCLHTINMSCVHVICEMFCVYVYIHTYNAHTTCLLYVYIHIRDHKLSVYMCVCVVCACCVWMFHPHLTCTRNMSRMSHITCNMSHITPTQFVTFVCIYDNCSWTLDIS